MSTTDLLIAVTLVLVAAAGTSVVLIREPARQAVTFSAFGLLLTVFFVAVQAPDVALSELAVGAAVIPLLLMLTIRKLRRPK